MKNTELLVPQQNEIVTPEIQQIMPVMNLIMDEMSQAFNEGTSYRILIADGKECRIPALIIKYYLEHLYSQFRRRPVSTIFVEGERLKDSSGRFELYSRSRIQIDNKVFKERESLSFSPTDKVLIVTNHLDAYERINLLAQELHQNSVPYDIASLTWAHDIEHYYNERKFSNDVHIYPQSATTGSIPDLSKFAGFTQVHHKFNTTLTLPREPILESRRDARRVVSKIIFVQSQHE